MDGRSQLPELKQWIDAQNAVTATYLDALPVRDA